MNCSSFCYTVFTDSTMKFISCFIRPDKYGKDLFSSHLCRNIASSGQTNTEKICFHHTCAEMLLHQARQIWKRFVFITLVQKRCFIRPDKYGKDLFSSDLCRNHSKKFKFMMWIIFIHGTEWSWCVQFPLHTLQYMMNSGFIDTSLLSTLSYKFFWTFCGGL
jgi:hypothetical protein